MLTATQLRKISQNASGKNEFEERVNCCVKGILDKAQQRARYGYCQCDLDLEDYPEEIRMPIIYKLEYLGYKARPHWFSNIYSISW